MPWVALDFTASAPSTPLPSEPLIRVLGYVVDVWARQCHRRCSLGVFFQSDPSRLRSANGSSAGAGHSAQLHDPQGPPRKKKKRIGNALNPSAYRQRAAAPVELGDSASEDDDAQ
ncbi:uncharacterized protein MONBRDRAFT_10315 [Monosiga brevicollis MX1]|uniref:Uncharacterized protein n=1 Tax=Monosiga brevicollis TaxID=81824 RepID=A9V5V1_MONBE|nr:uncharacterized protein MONBRDRAFT_10315 [Monosiga brevicollis MX1]EDQ87108.1 predicted protein [Monosiga brevicollis MX1]|eukprot:XP_001748051.1 hypothetical protein [Monosiga brevicollis MX1]